MTSVEYSNPAGQTVSEVPGRPGRVITGGQLWTSESGTPDPVRRPTNPFALIPGGLNEDDDPMGFRDTCLTCPPGMPCCCTAGWDDPDN